jgi:hypothetical protein
LTRSWFRDLAHDTRASTLISYPAVFSVPDSEFLVVTETGESINFTIPGYPLYIPFEAVDLVDGFDDFWRSCYHLVYEVGVTTVHETHRDLVKTVAARVGEIAEMAGGPAMTSDVFVPTDNVSALQVVGELVKERTSFLLVQMRSNESIVKDIINHLWEAQATLTANVFSRIADDVATLIGDGGEVLATTTIVEEMLRRVSEQSEYENLTTEERETLGEIVEGSVIDRKLGTQAMAVMVNRTLHELEVTKQRATSLETSSEEGGVYARLRDFVVSSSGLLAKASKKIGRLMDAAVEAEDTENILFLVSKTNKTFRHWGQGTGLGRVQSKDFRVNVSQSPSYLATRGWPAECDEEVLDSGTLCVSVESPLDRPISGGNVHYTDVTRESFAPYVSSWRIRVRALFDLSASTGESSNPILEHVDIITESVPLEFEISLNARSGWELEGVVYDSSNTFLGDAWETVCRFLDVAWDYLLKVFDWVLDGISWLVSLVKELMGTLLSYARDVLKAIYDVIEATTELLKSAISGVATLIGGLIESVASAFDMTEFRMSVLGGELEVRLNQDNGSVVEGIFETGGLRAVLLLKKLSEMNLTQEQQEKAKSDYDIVVNIDLWVGDLDLSGTFEPAMVLEESFFHASADWGDDWRIEFQVPQIERFHERKYTVEIPSIPTPVGTLDIELGILLKLREELRNIDLVAMVSMSFEVAWAETLGRDVSIESAARFVDRGISGAVDRLVEAIESNIDSVIEVVLYFEGQVRIGGTAGIGVRLSSVIGKEVLREGFSWLTTKLKGLISGFGEVPSVGVEKDLAFDLTSNIFLGLEVLFSVGTPRLVRMMSPDHELGTEVLFVISVRVNAAAITHLMGRSSGTWRVDFGIYLEGLPPGFFGNPITDGELANLWLLHGSASQAG